MSFGWSFGDVVAGINLIFKIYDAVSDGPRNSKVEATQFFADFGEVIARLDKWGSSKAACDKDQTLKASHEELKLLCTTFIKRHFRIIQGANPNTKTSRPGRSTWLKRVSFTASQVASLYTQVQWPLERKELSRLREKLQFFLQLSAWDVAIDTNQIVSEFKSSHAELLSSNLRLVSSHLDLVSLVTLNLKRVTHPLESGTSTSEIDYPMLRHLDQALRPPEPFRAIQAPSPQAGLPWNGCQHIQEAGLSVLSSHHECETDLNIVEESDMRGLISRRLDNMSMRFRRVETLESLPEDASAEGTSTTEGLITRLRNMRGQIGGAVGVSERDHVEVMHEKIVDAGSALRHELEAWNNLEERIEREILHPARHLTPGPDNTRSGSAPIPIPPKNMANSLSPPASLYNGWRGPTSSSPDNSRSFFSSSPGTSRACHQRRNSSVSSASASLTPSNQLEHYIRVQISYPGHTTIAVIYSITKFDGGDVRSVASKSQDGTTEIRHSVDLKAPALTETSMKPFLDNNHLDKTHHLRVQFQGAHSLKITKLESNKKPERYQCPPIYTFFNDKDYLEFQQHLLNKKVCQCKDVKSIKSTKENEVQCRLGTIRILLDLFSGTRHIFYFRHTSDQKPGFVEWPVNFFKDPAEPNRGNRVLTLESRDGRSLTLAKSLTRRGTGSSVTSIASYESSKPTTQSDRTAGSKSIRGLIIEFYDYEDCHEFWTEFRAKEVSFFDSHGLGFAVATELPADLPVELPG